jgi:2-methylcitrate dehydratase
VEYPLGHHRRRKEGEPVLQAKFVKNLRGQIPARRADAILELFSEQRTLEAAPVTRLMDLLAN